jgi:hypothetical protein
MRTSFHAPLSGYITDPFIGNELERLQKRVRELEADLAECSSYLREHFDIVDGEDGAPRPNKPMQLYRMIQQTLFGPGAF